MSQANNDNTVFAFIFLHLNLFFSLFFFYDIGLVIMLGALLVQPRFKQETEACVMNERHIS